jgi:hypothetical protein
MMKFLAYVFAILAFSPTAGWSEPAVTLHRPLSTIYDLYVGGVLAGELTFHARAHGDRYSATSVMRTAGLIGAVYRASFEAETEGRLAAGGLAPERFRAVGRMYTKVQNVEMTYRDAAPAAVQAEPAFVPKPWQIEPEDQAGTLDPVSAALTALAPEPAGTICNRSVEIYDGRRRYAIDLGAPEVEEGRIRCPAHYRRVAGYKPKELKETIDFAVWFEKRPDGFAHLVRAAGDSYLGLAVVLLRE